VFSPTFAPSAPTALLAPSTSVPSAPSAQSTPPFLHRPSSLPTSSRSSPALHSTTSSIQKSPSQRFPHISHDVMKIIAPTIEMPEINNDADRVAYRKKQDEIINKLMQFIEEK
jgi:hypothetical protein